MTGDVQDRWMAALEARHLADFRLVEVTRALRALSSAYVERRHAMQRGAALDSAGKRAAFSLFYGPLHFLAVAHIVRELDARVGDTATILDLGCGSGVAGAAWALESGGRPRILGVDRHPAAIEEAQWTYRQLGLDGVARQGDLARARSPRGETAIVAGYALNELPAAARERVWDTMRAAATHGAKILIVEPMARGLTPWWTGVATQAGVLGGRADEWRFAADLPEIVQRLDRAAGLNHREVTARSIYIP
jgi:SAM-dependent methyltransferase